MSRLLITGLSGTLAPHLAAQAKAQGITVLPWPRQTVSPDDTAAGELFLSRMRPDAIAHLGMGSEAWAAQLAGYAARHALPLVFTSSAMVFSHEPPGPHRREDPPQTSDEYGLYKQRCEAAIVAANPAAAIARIGWQIDAATHGNNMLAALDQWQAQQGEVAASRAWIPACSFMDDTAAALLQLLLERASGLFHLDSNAVEAWRFDELVTALARHFNRAWQIRVHDDYRHDQRLLGNEARMPALSRRLRRP